MTSTYRIQRGKLSGGYKTVYMTDSSGAAWTAYRKTKIKAGEKKRIQEDGRTIKSEREYWT